MPGTAPTALLPSLAPVTLPGPSAPPLLGRTANVFRFFGDPVRTLLGLHERYGNVVGLTRNDPAMVCAFDTQHYRDVFSDPRRFQNVVDAPYPMPPDHAAARLTDALTNMNGDVHKRQRRLLMPAFQKAALEAHGETIAQLTTAALDRWVPGATIDVADAMVELTLLVAVPCLFGLDSAQDDLGTLGMQFLAGLTSVGVMLAPYNVPGLPYAQMLRGCERLEVRLRALIAARRAAGAGDGARKDMLSILVDAYDEDGASLTDAELMGQSAVLFIAGHETTAFTLAWTLFLLDQHPHVASAPADEVARAMPDGNAAPTAAQLEQMPLLDRVIRESMRLLPATAFFFFRRLETEFKLGSYALPARSQLILTSLVAHRDPEIFPEPRRFDPDRWLTARPGPYEYVPFGAGPRLCIGAGFANMALRTMLPLIVRRFRLGLAPDARVSHRVQGITMGPRHGLPMTIARQDARYPAARPVVGTVHDLVALA